MNAIWGAGLCAVVLASGVASAETMVIDRESSKVYEGLVLSNPHGVCLKISNSENIRIRNSRIGPCLGNAIEIQGGARTYVENNTIFDMATGVYALNTSGVYVKRNQFRNPQGPLPRGQAVQFNRVAGGSVISNTSIADLGRSKVEDHFNFFRSEGVAIVDNTATGGSSRSGCGVIIGDVGGDGHLVRGNRLTNTGACGIGVAGGSNSVIEDNIVNGTELPWSNVGVYVWNQYIQHGVVCSNITVRNNTVNWVGATGRRNDHWFSENCWLTK